MVMYITITGMTVTYRYIYYENEITRCVQFAHLVIRVLTCFLHLIMWRFL